MKNNIIVGIFIFIILAVAVSAVKPVTRFEGDKAFINHSKGRVLQQPHTISPNEIATISFARNSTDSVYDLCFDFYNKDVDIITFDKHGFLGFKDNYKKINKSSGLQCMKKFNAGNNEVFDFQAVYNGVGKTKYDIYLIPSRYNYDFGLADRNNDLIILDPYLIGSLTDYNTLIAYFSFNNTINSSYGRVENTFPTTNIYFNDTDYDVQYETGITNPSNAFDESYATYAYVSTLDTRNAYSKFTKIDNLKGAEAEWKYEFVQDGTGSTITHFVNATIPDLCINAYDDYINMRYLLREYYYIWEGDGKHGLRIKMYCDDGNTWVLVDEDGSAVNVGGYSDNEEIRLYDVSMWQTNETTHTIYNDTLINSSYRIGGDYAVSGYDFRLNQDANDIFGSNDGTVNGGPVYTGEGLEFDGVEGTNVSIDSFSTPAETLSYCFWSNDENSNAGSYPLVSFEPDTYLNSVFLNYQGEYRVYDKNGDRFTTINIPIGWSHWCVVYDSPTSYVYLNGEVEKFSDSVDMVNTTSGLSIGENAYGYSFNGTIEQVLIYNRSLSEDEITKLYEEGNYTENIRGEPESAISFNGIDDYVEVQALDIGTGEPFSWSGWLKLTGDQNSNGIMGYGHSNRFFVYGAESGIPGKLFADFGVNYITTDAFDNVEQWNHAVYVNNGTHQIFYLNGVQDSGGWDAESGAEWNEQFVIGYDGYTQEDYSYQGSIDELMFFDYALSESEIDELYGGYDGAIVATVRDEDTLDILDGVEFDIIGTNFSTTDIIDAQDDVINGITDDFVTIRYSKDGYNKRLYYHNFTEQNFTNTFYLVNTSDGTATTITLYDNYNNKIQNAYIYLQRYFVSSNSYRTVEMAKTNIEGQAVVYTIFNDEFYKFAVYYPWDNLKLITDPSKVYSSSITLQIDLIDGVSDNWDQTNNITYNLSYNNATQNFRFIYSTGNSEESNITLNVYKQKLQSKELIASSTDKNTAGTILANIGTEENDTLYIAEAIHNFADQNYTETLSIINYIKPSVSPWGNFGYLMAWFLTMIFAFIGVFSIAVAVILVPLPNIMGIVIGIVPKELLPVSIVISVLGLIIAIIIGKKG